LESESATKRSAAARDVPVRLHLTVGALVAVALLQLQPLQGRQRRSLRDIGSQGRHTSKSLRDASSMGSWEKLTGSWGIFGRLPLAASIQQRHFLRVRSPMGQRHRWHHSGVHDIGGIVPSSASSEGKPGRGQEQRHGLPVRCSSRAVNWLVGHTTRV
jgi:hypothetical protein